MARPRRTEYVITHPAGSAQKETRVFADDIFMTNTGDIVFQQLREGTGVDDSGAIVTNTIMVNVMTIRRETYDRLHAVNKDGGEWYKESGLVELAKA